MEGIRNEKSKKKEEDPPPNPATLRKRKNFFKVPACSEEKNFPMLTKRAKSPPRGPPAGESRDFFGSKKENN